MGYKFYNDEYPYTGMEIYDENGQPITPKQARRVSVVYAVLFFTAAAIMMVILFVILHSRAKLYERCSAEVVGAVVENIKNGTSEDSAVFPVFKYQYNGRTYEQKSDEPADLAVGEYRTIHIDPTDPTVYYIEKADGTAAAALSFLSGVCIILGIVTIIVVNRSKKNEQAQQSMMR